MTRTCILTLAVLVALAGPAQAQFHPSKGGNFRSLGFNPERLADVEPTSANPFTAFLPAGVDPDYAYWTTKLAAESTDRAATRAARGLRATPSSTYRERERGGLMPNGSTDTAERIPGFGAASENPGVEVSGVFADLQPATLTRSTVQSEDQATGFVPHPISLYAFAGQYRGAEVSGAQIGDGPFSATGDVDLYLVEVTSPDTYLLVSVKTPIGSLDPVMAMYDADGQFVFANDDSKLPDGSTTEDPTAGVLLERPGRYLLFVWGYTPNTFGVPLMDPMDPSTGVGAGSTGPYQLEVYTTNPDNDAYAVDLQAGDVLAAASPSAALWDLAIVDPDGVVRMNSRSDLSALYAEEGPLASPAELGQFEKGRTAAIVAPKTGTYTVVARGMGPYRLFIQAAEPGHRTQTERIFVDFDGHTVDAGAEFGRNSQMATLTGLRAFLPRWGLTAADEDAVIDAVMATLQRTLQDEIRQVPGMRSLRVELTNSRDHADPGDSVNRLIVGGTMEELGIETIGIASTVDIGNYRRNDVGVILLDLLSEPADNPNSLNQYGLAAGVSKPDLVGHGVGIVASHEAAHYLGMHHTDNADEIINIIDQGGRLTNSLGIGIDRVFGTTDDRTVRYRDDRFSAYGQMLGTQATPTALGFSLHPAPRDAQSGGVAIGTPRGGNGAVSVGAVRGGAPASQGYTYDFGSVSVRMTGLAGAETLWVLEPGSELWRRAQPGEVAALLQARDTGKPVAVTTEASVDGAEANRAVESLRAVAERE